MERRRQRLIESNLPLVEHVVLRVSVGFPRFVDRQELIAAGMLGLTEAAQHFDFERGVPFGAYAARRIRGAVLDVARSNDWTPRSVRQLARTTDDAAQELTSRLGRLPGDDELAAEIGITLDELRTLREQVDRGVIAALDRRMDLDGPDVHDVLADTNAAQPDEFIENLELRGYLRAALLHLDERLRIIIVGYYLEGRTVEELGRRDDRLMLNRVATSTTSSRMLESLESADSALTDIEGQVASGKRIQQVSDNPTDAMTALSQRIQLGQTQQYTRNATDATNWLNTADSTLSSIVTTLQSARTSLVQASSGALDPTARTAIASQLQAASQSVLSLANTTRLGRPIFAGTAGVTQAFDSSGNYLGDQGAVTRTVADGENLQVNQTGTAVFGTYNATDPTQGNVFQLLNSLSAAVTSGNTAAITAGLNQLDAATSSVQNAQVTVGSTTNQVAAQADQAQTATTNLQSGIASLENVDVAQASIALASRQVAYQAALEAASKLAQPTLLDFLR